MMQALRPCLKRFVECILSGEYNDMRWEGNPLIVASGGCWKVFLKEIWEVITVVK